MFLIFITFFKSYGIMQPGPAPRPPPTAATDRPLATTKNDFGGSEEFLPKVKIFCPVAKGLTPTTSQT